MLSYYSEFRRNSKNPEQIINKHAENRVFYHKIGGKKKSCSSLLMSLCSGGGRGGEGMFAEIFWLKKSRSQNKFKILV